MALWFVRVVLAEKESNFYDITVEGSCMHPRGKTLCWQFSQRYDEHMYAKMVIMYQS